MIFQISIGPARSDAAINPKLSAPRDNTKSPAPIPGKRVKSIRDI